MTTNDETKNKSELSEAASIMGRKDTSHEEKSRAAQKLGQKGGANSHSGGRPKKDQ